MVKKLRFEDVRAERRHRRPRGIWVLEPRDAALIGAALAALAWLQWASQTS